MPFPPRKLQSFAQKNGEPTAFGGKKKGLAALAGGKGKPDDGNGKGHGGHEDGEHEGGKHVDIEAIIDRVDNGDGEPHLMDMAAGADGSGDEAPHGVHDEGMWKKAVGMLKSKWDDLHDPVAVALHVYKELGGSTDGDDHKEPDGDEDEHGHEPDAYEQ